jgi:Flp pilus assembly pilin Flp
MAHRVRRFCSRETGSALLEYALIIAVMAMGLVAGLAGFRDKLGGVTERTAESISHQSNRGYGSPAGAEVGPVAWSPSPEPPDSAAEDGEATESGPGTPATATDEE